jgi:hypothetical protein
MDRYRQFTSRLQDAGSLFLRNPETGIIEINNLFLWPWRNRISLSYDKYPVTEVKVKKVKLSL